MCGVCGCEQTTVGALAPEALGLRHQHHDDPAVDDEHEHEHEHLAEDGSVYRHSHKHEHGPTADHAHEHALMDPVSARVITVERDVLSRNDELAAKNRATFAQTHTFVVNLMSSPGSGKTTLLTRTLRALPRGLAVAVIEGDQQTELDAERIRATGVPAVQINTGKGCHLDAAMVGKVLDQVRVPDGLLFIENVGNLVCPAGFDLGEHRRVVVVSVTEGEDKPLKYPDMFATADAVVINKADLLPHLHFNLGLLEANVRRLRPQAPTFVLSASTGAGLEPWLHWLERGIDTARAATA